MPESRIYFAPLEGITTYPYRQVHAAMFSGIDKYFTPFLAANQTKSFMKKEKRDVDPANNILGGEKGSGPSEKVIPQILTNKADQFVWAVHEMEQRGYREVNLNLGCPMATVFTKKRGAGFLAEPDELDRFFDEVFNLLERDASGAAVTVKTRLGVEDEKETLSLISVFNRYPIAELTVHARLRKDFYTGQPRLDAFAAMAQESTLPLCYNGDICTVEDWFMFRERFPRITRVMIGRGLLRDPALAEEIRKEEKRKICSEEEMIPAVDNPDQNAAQLQKKAEICRFHDALFALYRKESGNDSSVLWRMKELWFYLGSNFPGEKKVLKKIRKAGNFEAYEKAVRELI